MKAHTATAKENRLLTKLVFKMSKVLDGKDASLSEAVRRKFINSDLEK